MTTQLKTEKHITYFLTQLSTEDAHAIIKNKNNPEEINKLNIKLNIDIKNIELIGSKDEASAAILSRYVAYLKGYAPSFKNPDRKIQFRDYSKTEEAQLKNAWLVAVCEDARTSSYTLLKTLKLPYLCIWKKENS